MSSYLGDSIKPLSNVFDSDRIFEEEFESSIIEVGHLTTDEATDVSLISNDQVFTIDDTQSGDRPLSASPLLVGLGRTLEICVQNVAPSQDASGSDVLVNSVPLMTSPPVKLRPPKIAHPKIKRLQRRAPKTRQAATLSNFGTMILSKQNSIDDKSQAEAEMDLLRKRVLEKKVQKIEMEMLYRQKQEEHDARVREIDIEYKKAQLENEKLKMTLLHKQLID